MNELLRTFIAIVESGSMTEAARQVYKTQSAISQQISRLEKQLGRVLLVRDHPIRLTEAGERLLGYARQMMDLESRILGAFIEPDMAGDIRLGIPEDYSHVLLEPVLDGFVHRHPRIRLQIECDLTETLTSRIQQGHLDIAVTKTKPSETLSPDHLITSSPLAWVGFINALESGRDIPIVVSPHPCIYRENAIQALRQAGIPWRVVFSSYQYHNLIHAVRSGLGIGILPLHLVPHDLPILSDDRLPPLGDIQLGIMTASLPSAPHRAIIGLIRETLRRHAAIES